MNIFIRECEVHIHVVFFTHLTIFCPPNIPCHSSLLFRFLSLAFFNVLILVSKLADVFNIHAVVFVLHGMTVCTSFHCMIARKFVSKLQYVNSLCVISTISLVRKE